MTSLDRKGMSRKCPKRVRASCLMAVRAGPLVVPVRLPHDGQSQNQALGNGNTVTLDVRVMRGVIGQQIPEFVDGMDGDGNQMIEWEGTMRKDLKGPRTGERVPLKHHDLHGVPLPGEGCAGLGFAGQKGERLPPRDGRALAHPFQIETPLLDSQRLHPQGRLDERLPEGGGYREGCFVRNRAGQRMALKVPGGGRGTEETRS